MIPFKVFYTGDYLNEQGQLTMPDIQLCLYDNQPFLQYDFLRDQSPKPGERDYWDRLYSLEIQSHHVAQANGIVIFRPWVKASAFAAGAANLVVIGRAGAGYDKIDLEACTANDVAVFNCPDTLTHSTASAAFLFILALSKRLPEHERLVRSARWDLQPQVIGDDLPEKTLGIIGLGATGRELARLMGPWQMRMIAYSPRANAQQASALGVTLVPTLDEVFRESDFVSLHNRLEPRTRGMIGERQLRLMKPTAYFINVARGELVEQEVLVRALRERWFAGAGLDVFEHEPLPQDDPLVGLDNVILTPHWLPSTRRCGRLTMSEIAQGMLRSAHGLLPSNILNRAVIGRPGFQTKLARFARATEE
jgi:phosphoglycerate dehydrogenase-like enzyme